MRSIIGFDSCPADTFLLAAFGAKYPGKHAFPERILDLGCGPGRLLYEFALDHPLAEIYGLDANRDYIDMAASALMEKGVGVRVEKRLTIGPGVHLIHGDVREIRALFPAECFDAIFLNPPYFQPGEGRLPKNALRASFRHARGSGIEDFLVAGGYLVRPAGVIHAIYPSTRKKRFMASLEASGLEVSLLQDIYPGPSYSEPRWSLFQLTRRGAGKEAIFLAPSFDPDAFMGYERERQNKV